MALPHIRLDLKWPHLEMTTTLPRVTIDDVDARGELGLKPMPRFMRDQTQRARTTGLEGIAQIARDGDRLAKVEESANAIVEIAAEKWSKAREVNIDHAPKNRPRVDLQRGRVTTRLVPGHVHVLLPHIPGTGRRLDVWA